jgi:hypothetical protein
MSLVPTYDSKEVFVIVGPNALSGFAEGSKVTVERTEETWTDYCGSDGKVARAKNNDKRGKVTIRLMHTSPSNETLMAYYLLDESSNAGVFPLTIKDNNGNSMYFAESAWILKPAPADFAEEIGEREYVIACANLIVFNGSTS